MEFSWLNLCLIVFIAWFMGTLAVRMGYPHVLGELLGGIIFGPPLLGLVHGDEGIKLLGQLGVLMMVLFIGIQVNPRDLIKAIPSAALPALTGFLVPFVPGYLLMVSLGQSANSGLIVGTVMGTTALAMVLRLVTDMQMLQSRLGQSLTAVALFSVILVLVSFSAVLGIVKAGSVDTAQVLLVLGKALLFLVLIVAAGLYLFPLIGKWHERFDRHPGPTDELTVAVILGTAVAALAEFLGLSFILGAFFTGLFINESMFEKGTFGNVVSTVRDVSLGFLAPVFYVSAGFNVSFSAFQTPALVFGVLVVAALGKFLGGALAYLLNRRGWREAAVVGVGMNARGSIDIIVAGVGLQLGVISQNQYTALILMIFVATLMVPVLFKFGLAWMGGLPNVAPATD